jgi:hypothetical protein
LSIFPQFVLAQRTPGGLGYRASEKSRLQPMEGTMSGRAADVSRYPTVEFMVHVIAAWIDKIRTMNGLRDELGKCSAEEKRQLAKDLGIPVEDLRSLVAKGPVAADALPKMLAALSVDAQALANADFATMRDLQRTCAFCDHKKLCQRELAEGTAARHFRQFCPNAHTLDALPRQAASSTCG